MTSGTPAAYISRSLVFLNLPTEVFGTSERNVHRSGSRQRGSFSARNARSSSGVTATPATDITAASGRSSPFSSGTPITAASSTEGRAISRFSNSTEEIHSPPVTALAWPHPAVPVTSKGEPHERQPNGGLQTAPPNCPARAASAKPQYGQAGSVSDV